MIERGLVFAQRRSPLSLCAALAGALLVPLAISAASAQANYPDRSVRLVVPYGAGGVADVGMRILSEKLSTHLKQQFVVENRPGAGGIIAAKAVSSSPADGYTLLMTGNNNAISASMFKSLPYNVLTDFASVSTTSFFDLLIVTRANSPLKTLQDVVKAARANPGKINAATTNPGSTQNLAALLFGSVTDSKISIVPYRTSSEMATAVLRGDVDIAFEFYSALVGPIADKQIVALASTGPKRASYLTNVPTVKEAGVDNYEVLSWNGISVPTGTPPQVVQVLNRAIGEVLKAPDLQEKAKTMGMEMRGSTPEAMNEIMKSDTAKWAAVIEKANIPKQE